MSSLLVIRKRRESEIFILLMLLIDGEEDGSGIWCSGCCGGLKETRKITVSIFIILGAIKTEGLNER